MPKKPIKTVSPSKPKITDGTAAKLLMLISIKSNQRLRGANISKYNAAKTAVGKDNRKVNSKVKKEPRSALPMPANSASRESAAVKNLVLKDRRISPLRDNESSHAICRSLTTRCSAGSLASLGFLIYDSACADSGSHILVRCPTNDGSARTQIT